LFVIKTKKIKSLFDVLVDNKSNYMTVAAPVGHGFTITDTMVDKLSMNPTKKQKQDWASKCAFSKK